ncbi:response regulator [Paenibacillus abyssi]|uniref:Circadian input-output histidine kinase CikA n=1 Tax=Paenibacillus abyssi TaxID=1340531 RepID=A0A917D0Z9_9BACL|nr:response regulator [Paenibacillus abyssi]GGG06764.1 hypothetical protein GCM10010916_24610 [Paenibacillus abyssi]
MKALSLRSKMLLLVLLVTVIPLTFVGIANYQAARTTIMDTLVQNAGDRIANSAYGFSSWLDARLAEVQVMSRTDKVRFGTDEERLDYFNREMRRAGQAFAAIGFADSDGKLSLGMNETIDITSHLSFNRVMNGGVVVTNPFRSSLSGEIIFLIQVPVYGSEDQVIGSINASILSETAFRQFSRIQADSSDVLQLITSEGEVIYHPDPSYIFQSNIKDDNNPLQSISDSLLSSSTGVIELGGERSALVFHTAIEGTPWRMILVKPYDEITQPLSVLLWRTVFFIVVAELLIAGLIISLFNRVISRISRILSVTEKVSAGEFIAEPIPAETEDEIDQLNRSVNGMIEHLRELFGRLDAIINQNGFAFIALDEHYRVVYFSKTAERMLGYQAEEVIHHATLLTFIDPEEIREAASQLSERLGRVVPADLSVLIELRNEQFSYDKEWTFIRKDGTRVPVAYSSNGLRDRNGKFNGVVGIARDITRLKHSEKARDRLLEILEAAKDMIASVDESGKLIYLNPAGRAMIGLEEDGFKPGKVQHPLLSAPLHEGMEQASKQGYWETETSFVSRSGQVIYVSQIIVVHRNVKTGEVFYSVIARDISEQKRVQQEMEQAKREAEEANQAKSHFLARMSHEIRTPLNGIIGLTGLMQKTQLNELQRDYIGKVGASSEALLHIINDILDFSKIEAGKLELEEAAFVPDDLLLKLCDTMSVYLSGKEDIEFMVQSPDRMPTLLIGDAYRIHQVLLNLCVNAVKFTEKGIVTLSIETVDYAGAEVSVRFCITDTGIGIATDQLGRLFEPFTQADGTSSRKYGGTGLGLMIVKSLIEQMGGKLEVESSPGQGSRFSFTLCLAKSPNSENQSVVQTLELHEGLSAWVIEDHEMMRSHLCDRLESMAVQPTGLDNWKSAIQLLLNPSSEQDNELPNFALVDMEMPDMFGHHTWLEFHRGARQRDVMTIVMTTAYGRDEMLKMAAEERPDAILLKPISRAGLYRALIVLLEGNHDRAREAAEASAEAESLKPKGKLLLAEDNRINQLVTVEILRQYGYEIEVAENGLEALRRLSEERPDAILMDIHMPEMDGIELTQRIRAQEIYADLPIIALTANVIQKDHDHYLEIGMNDVITKPIHEERLVAVLRKWVDKAGEVHDQTEAARNSTLGSKSEAAAGAVRLGYDRGKVLERLNGKEVILEHVLSLFLRDYQNYPAQIRSALEAGDVGTAVRLAHTLKGVAGNLCADELAEASEKLEHTLKNNSSDGGSLAASLKHIESFIAYVISQIREQDGSNHGSS